MLVDRFVKIVAKTIFVVMVFSTQGIGAVHSSAEIGEKLIYQGKFEEAKKVLTQEAKKGSVRALYLLGSLSIAEFNPNKDYEKGISLLHQAADKNFAPALTELAHLYFGGEGVDKDQAQALVLYTRAADLGDGPAQFNCGIMYKKGQGGEKNIKLGYYYLCLASLNSEDLGKVAKDAGEYRDQLARLLSPEDRQEVLAKVARVTRHKTI